MYSLNGTSSTAPSQVPYATVHDTFIRLVLVASRRRLLAQVAPALDAAMRPADNATKLARLNAVAATLESEK